MNYNIVFSDFNNSKITENISNLQKGRIYNQSMNAHTTIYKLGDDQKNHQKSQPLILYEDIPDRQQSIISQQQTLGDLQKINIKFTQSIEEDNHFDNSTSFYQIIDKYYDYYNNQSTIREILSVAQNSGKKYQRLYTEQNEQSQYHIKRKSHKRQIKMVSILKKINSFSLKKDKQLD